MSLLSHSSLLPPQRPPTSTLFPYTTLFRSLAAHPCGGRELELRHRTRVLCRSCALSAQGRFTGREDGDLDQPVCRSEEHTSELQSHSDLVCRLLLEKKKKNTNEHDYVECKT